MFHKKTREFPGRIDPNEGFRDRRRRRRRRIQQRRIGALLLVAGVAVALTFGFRAVTGGETVVASTSEEVSESIEASPTASFPVLSSEITFPEEMRGVHMTMPMINLADKLDEFIALRKKGLNTLQIDIKDEDGRIAFTSENLPLSQSIGSATNFYNAEVVADKVHAADLFLVGRIVVFQDPIPPVIANLYI